MKKFEHCSLLMTLRYQYKLSTFGLSRWGTCARSAPRFRMHATAPIGRATDCLGGQHRCQIKENPQVPGQTSARIPSRIRRRLDLEQRLHLILRHHLEKRRHHGRDLFLGHGLQQSFNAFSLLLLGLDGGLGLH